MSVPSPTSRSGSRIYISVWDLFWALITPGLALYLRNPDLLQFPNWELIGWYWSLSSGFAILAFFAFRLQDGMTRYFSLQEGIDVAEAVLFSELMTFLSLFTLTRLDGIPRSTPVIHGLMLLGGLIFARIVIRIVFSQQEDPVAQYSARRERIVLVGANPLASAYIRLLDSFSPHQTVIAVLDASPEIVGKAISGIRVVGAPGELDAVLNEFAVHGIGADRVVVAGEANFLGATVLQEMERVCKNRKIQFCFLPRLLGISEEGDAAKAVRAVPRQSYPLVSSYFILKRWIDVFGALALIVLLSPLFLVTGLLVLFDVGRPLLFWQERVGWKGRSFLIYKFRTLKAPFAGESRSASELREPSLIGRMLRATRLDELPQLFNVLVGDMSLIGPRPLLPQDQPNNILVRLSVRPGITGWAQLNGGKLLTAQEKETLDEWYVQKACLSLDLRIVVMTLLLLIRTRMSSLEAIADAEQAKTKKIDVPRTSDAPSLVAAPPKRSLTGANEVR
jgi:lipopolysaccharide/colanic/teichoic acid biosynthesis glycosyltransferase